MNNPSPLTPQGSLLEQKASGRARVKIAVFFVLAIHCVGLLAFLMLGCKKETDVVQPPPENTNPAPMLEQPTNEAPMTEATNPTPAVVESNPPPIVETPAAQPPPVMTPPAAAANEYAIAKGDTLSSVAKKFGVSLRALTDANPNVNPTRLKIGQKIQVPAKSMTEAPTAAPSAAAPVGANGSELYTVKSGDSLGRIATQNHTTVKAIKAANGLKTDRIKVGQKLKIPGGKAAAVPASPEAAPISAPVSAPAPAPDATTAPPALPGPGSR